MPKPEDWTGFRSTFDSCFSQGFLCYGEQTEEGEARRNDVEQNFVKSLKMCLWSLKSRRKSSVGAPKVRQICLSGAGMEIDGFSVQSHRCVWNFSMSRDSSVVCEKKNLSQIFLSSPSVLFAFVFLFAGWMERALMWQSQCCDRTPKRNQMLFGLACGAEV